MGGLWEAGVRIAKHHLKRVIGNALLTYEELNSLLIQIEGIMNSRPLSPLSSDPSDFTPLTPAHFLIGASITSIPDPDVKDIPISRLSRYQYIQSLKQHFWQRWSKEVVSEMQQRTKWKQGSNHLKLDTLVLVKEDNVPPAKWHLGRIVQLHPGNDGISRVATIKTTNGLIKRAFSKLCPLPTEDIESSSQLCCDQVESAVHFKVGGNVCDRVNERTLQRQDRDVLGEREPLESEKSSQESKK